MQVDILNLDLGEKFDIICGVAILHEIPLEDTPKLLDFFDRHLNPDGFAFFQENSFFTPAFRLVRRYLVGRYGIPKYGSEQETPFDSSRWHLYQQHFKYSERSAEVFVLFERIHAYLIRSRSPRISRY